MAEADKIQNLDQLETWLRTQDVRISRAIAARAALRALPVLMAHRVQIASKTRGASLLLSRLRATLISGVASTCSLDMKRMQNSAHAAVAPYAEDSPASATVAFASSAKFSASDAASTVYTSARTALSYSTLSARYDARSATLSAAFIDAGHGRDGDPHQIFAAPLWPNSDAIAPLLKIWTDFEALPDPEGIWSFWRDWYRSMLNGEPLDWELQLQVALIIDDIWQAGPEAVAKDIEPIYAKYKLEREIAQFKTQLTTLQKIYVPPQIGDNGGPPLDYSTGADFKTDGPSIRQHLDALESEIKKPVPSRNKLQTLAHWFVEFFKNTAAYVGEKLDLILTKGAETVGSTGTKAAIAYFTATSAAENEKIHSLVQAMLNFIKIIAGG